MAALPGAEVHPYKYGFFDALAFLLFPLRWRTLRRFREFLEGRSAQWEGRTVHVVAHSFGTFIVARTLKALNGSTSIRFGTVILAGGIVPQRFDWDGLVRDELVERVVNDCGERDVWPLVANVGIVGAGASGRFGYLGSIGPATQVFNRFYDFGHSGFFDSPDPSGETQRPFMATQWVPLLAGAQVPSSFTEPARSRVLADLIFLFEPLKIVLLVVLAGWPLWRAAEAQRASAQAAFAARVLEIQDPLRQARALLDGPVPSENAALQEVARRLASTPLPTAETRLPGLVNGVTVSPTGEHVAVTTWENAETQSIVVYSIAGADELKVSRRFSVGAMFGRGRVEGFGDGGDLLLYVRSDETGERLHACPVEGDGDCEVFEANYGAPPAWFDHQGRIFQSCPGLPVGTGARRRTATDCSPLPRTGCSIRQRKNGGHVLECFVGDAVDGGDEASHWRRPLDGLLWHRQSEMGDRLVTAHESGELRIYDLIERRGPRKIPYDGTSLAREQVRLSRSHLLLLESRTAVRLWRLRRGDRDSVVLEGSPRCTVTDAGSFSRFEVFTVRDCGDERSLEVLDTRESPPRTVSNWDLPPGALHRGDDRQFLVRSPEGLTEIKACAATRRSCADGERHQYRHSELAASDYARGALVTGSLDGSVRLWRLPADLEVGSPLGDGPFAEIAYVEGELVGIRGVPDGSGTKPLPKECPLTNSRGACADVGSRSRKNLRLHPEAKIATYADGGEVRRWSLPDLEPLAPIATELAGIGEVVAAADGAIGLVGGDGESVRVQVWTRGGRRVTDVPVSGCGYRRNLVIAGEGRGRTVLVACESEDQSEGLEELPENVWVTTGPYTVSLDPTGSRVAMTFGAVATVKVVELETGREAKLYSDDLSSEARFLSEHLLVARTGGEHASPSLFLWTLDAEDDYRDWYDDDRGIQHPPGTPEPIRGISRRGWSATADGRELFYANSLGTGPAGVKRRHLGSNQDTLIPLAGLSPGYFESLVVSDPPEKLAAVLLSGQVIEWSLDLPSLIRHLRETSAAGHDGDRGSSPAAGN